MGEQGTYVGPLSFQMCACPPNLQAGFGQIHNPGCSLNPSRRCSRCKGTGYEPDGAKENAD